MSNKKLLGKRIKELRKAQGLTQEKLAEILGMETGSLSAIESGRNFPSLHVLENMANVLNRRLVDFFIFEHLKNPVDLESEISKIVCRQDEKTKSVIYKIVKSGFSL